MTSTSQGFFVISAGTVIHLNAHSNEGLNYSEQHDLLGLTWVHQTAAHIISLQMCKKWHAYEQVHFILYSYAVDVDVDLDNQHIDKRDYEH
jgi:hypothetical protein